MAEPTKKDQAQITPAKRAVAMLLGVPLTQLEREAAAVDGLNHLKTQEQTFSQQDLASIDHFLRGMQRRTVGAESQLTAEGLTQQLSSMVAGVERKIQTAHNLIELTPELKQACRVLVSSILSPADMQTHNPIQIRAMTDELTPNQLEKVQKLLTDHFHKNYRLAARFNEWYSRIYFESGAVALAVLPDSINDDLLKVYRETNSDGFVTTEDHHFGKMVLDEFDAYSDPRTGAMWWEPQISDVLDDINTQVALEAHDVVSILDYTRNFVRKFVMDGKTSSDGKSRPKRGVEVNFNPAGLFRAARDQKEKETKLYDRFFGAFTENGKGYTPGGQNILAAQASLRELTDTTRPLLLELPTSSVIPVAVPGAPREHIGYFVMVDESGNPFVPSAGDLNRCANPTDRMIDNAYQTFDPQHANDTGSSSALRRITRADKLRLLDAVFSTTLRAMLRSELADVGLPGADVACTPAIANVLFYRLLQANNVRMIYVPASLMVYYAVEYNEDGTGRSLIEGASQIMSLRATLLVANVMATIQNAVRHHNITVDIDPENTQAEQILAMVRKMFIENHTLSFADNLPSISRNILAESVRVTPRGLTAGDSPAISVEASTETGNSGIAIANTEIIDRFTEMIISWWGIPYSVFNRLSEDEFSRSIALNNLLMSNMIAEQQIKLAIPNSKLVRLLVTFDMNLRRKLAEILTLGTPVKEDAEVSVEDVKEKGVNTESSPDANDPNELLRRLVYSIEVVLPAPNVAPQRSMFAEIAEFNAAVEQMVDRMFPDALVSAHANDELAREMPSIRANMMAMVTRKYIEQLSASTFKLPNLEEFLETLTTDQQDNSQVLTNFRAGMIRFAKEQADLLTRATVDPEVTPADDQGSADAGYPDTF